jgi:hypothetical protein
MLRDPKGSHSPPPSKAKQIDNIAKEDANGC